MKTKRLSYAAALALLAMLAADVTASNGTWSQLIGGTYNWADSGNWSGGTVAGGAVGNTAALTADITGPVTINLGSAITLGAISIGDPASAWFPYIINPNGGSFILDATSAGPATITKSGGRAMDVINADIALLDDLTIANQGDSGYFLLLSGVIGGSGKTVTVDNGGYNRNVVLAGRSTYSGKTTLTYANVIFNSLANADGTASALGAPGNVTDGTITFGNSQSTLKYIGTGHASDRVIDLSGGTNPQTLDASGLGKLALSSALTVTGAGSKTLVLTGSGEGELQGAIPNYDATRITSLSKTGTGTWTLKGNNTFTGPITVNGGTLGIGHDNAISTGGALTLTAGRLMAVGGPRTITNAVAISSEFGFTGSEDLTLTAAIPFTGDYWTLNNYLASGKTLTLSAINLTDGGNRRSILTGTGDTTFTGAVANGGSGAGSLYMWGRGTLTLKGTNTYTGSTTIQDGTVLVDYASGALAAASTLDLGRNHMGAGMLLLKGAPGLASAQTLGNLTMTQTSGAGGGSIKLVGVGGGSMALTLSDNWARGGNIGSTLNIDLSSGAATLTSSPSMANNIVGGNISHAFVTVTDAAKTGFATVSGGNVVAYAAATTLADGSDNSATNFKTKVGDAGYIGNTLTLTAASPVNVNTLELDSSSGTGVLDLGGRTLAIEILGLLATGANDFTIQNGTVGGGGAGASELIVHQYATGTLTISAAGGGSVTKTGPGKLVLSGASAATGTTRVNQGVVRLEHATGGGTGKIAVQNGAALELNGVAVGNRELPYLSGDGIATNGALRCIATSSYGGLITVGYLGGRINADSGTTLTLTKGISTTSQALSSGAGNFDVTLGGAGNIVVNTVNITGGGGVIKDGTGTAELSAANDYTGPTTVNAGTLKITGSLASGSAVTINNTGTLTGNGTCSGTVRVKNGGTIKTLENGATVDKLTVGSLVLDGGSIASFEVASGNNVDYIDVTTAGSLADTAGLTILPGAKVRLSAPKVSGTYQLIKYTGVLKGSVSDLAVDNPEPAGTYEFSTAGGYVVLQSTVKAAGTMMMIR